MAKVAFRRCQVSVMGMAKERADNAELWLMMALSLGGWDLRKG
jgi:hypothetical protein